MTSKESAARLDRAIDMGFLLDFYAQLLTPKQEQALRLFYEEDLSLSEIAQEVGSSRQAVHELVKKGEALLHFYEEKLALGAAYRRRRQLLAELGLLLTPIVAADDTGKRLRQILAALEEEN